MQGPLNEDKLTVKTYFYVNLHDYYSANHWLSWYTYACATPQPTHPQPP